MDTQKSKTLNEWLYVWDALGTDECRQNTICIEIKHLLTILDSYLRKHKFCGDCKLKVIRAFNALIGELDPAKEKGFNAGLYSGIQHCAGETGCSYCAAADRTNKSTRKTNKHLRLSCDKQFLMNLILKAEPEIYGSRRERHAKTIEIAQEEVLTCIGVYLYDRFHRIYQSLRVEEQTWQILFHASILTLKKAYELEQEKLEGISKLELLCAELDSISCQCGANCGSPRRSKCCRSRKQCNKKSQSKNSSNNNNKSSKSGQQCKNSTDAIDELEEESDLDEDESKNLNDSNYSSNLSSSNSGKDLDEENYEYLDEEEEDSLIKSINTTTTSCSSKLADLSSTSIGSSDAKMASNSKDCPCLSLNDFDSELYSSEFFADSQQQFSECCLITDEEKNEYYANKSSLLNERRNRREMLQQRFLNFKMNSSGFKIRPRNVS